MTIETILRQKGTDVATIEPEASVRKAADWLRVKNIGALVVTSGNAVLDLISEREIVHAFSRYGETGASAVGRRSELCSKLLSVVLMKLPFQPSVSK